MKLLAALFFFLSCQVKRKPLPPLYKVFKAIQAEKYKPYINDCSNKAAKYLRALHGAGIDSHIVVYGTAKGLHAVVSVNGHYFDPTLGVSKWRVRPDSIAYTIKINELDNHGDEFK